MRSQGNAGNISPSLILLAWLLSAGHSAAAVVGPAGYTNGFGTMPPAADWGTLSVPGAGTDVYDSNVEVAALSAAAVTTPAAADPNNPPASNSLAVWSSGYLQTRPTLNRLTVLLGRFQNNTGSNAAGIGLSYRHTVVSANTTEDPGKGTRLYYSVTGLANGWINLPTLNTTASTDGSSTMATNLAVNWLNGRTLFLLWVDDNAGAGSDSANQLDNFSLRVTAATPTNFYCLVTSPAHLSATLAGTPIAIAAQTGNGTPPYAVEFFTNSGPGNAIFASAGMIASPPYRLALGALPLGTHHAYAVSRDSAAESLVTTSATNTFTVAEPIALEFTGPADGAIVDHATPVIGTAAVTGGTPPYSVQFYLDEVPDGPAVVAAFGQHNYGTLAVGTHTIRATATDASNWRSNSLVRTIQVSGPLAARLAPTNGAILTYGAPLTFAATVAGGTAPYAATLHIEGLLDVPLVAPLFQTNLGTLPAGRYPCYVAATDASVPTQRAFSSTNVITIRPPPLRILPVGDSITLGVAVPGGYRAPLYHLLTNAGHAVDFVGTQTGNTAPNLPDNAHEGYSGWLIRDIDGVILKVLAAVPEPDIILLLIGVNDFLRSDDTAQATNRLEALIARMAIARPNARIIVASIMALYEPFNTQVQTTFNPFVPALCERQRALGRQVYFTDMRSAVPLADMPDQLHPNQLGYNKMATNWFAAIKSLPCSNCPPLFTQHPRTQAMLPGTNVMLEAAASGRGTVRYQWRFQGANIPSATNATYAFTNASLLHQGNYTVAASDSRGTTLSSNALLYLLVRPGFVLNPLPQTVLQGGTARFTAIATGPPPIWYRWQRNTGPITTNHSGVLIITNVQSSYTIRVAATNYATGPNGILMTPSTGVTLTMLPDFDGDGMADAWETQHGLNTNEVADADWDIDGDGMSNRSEFTAGTSPTDAFSVLQLTLAHGATDTLAFFAQANIGYTVQFRTNLTSSAWGNLTNVISQPEAREVLVTIPSQPPQWERYYRIMTPTEP